MISDSKYTFQYYLLVFLFHSKLKNLLKLGKIYLFREKMQLHMELTSR